MRSQDDLHEAAGWSDQWKFIGLNHTNLCTLQPTLLLTYCLKSGFLIPPLIADWEI